MVSSSKSTTAKPLVFFVLLSCLLFSGIIFGYASLLLLLEKEGVYSELCTDGRAPCEEQENKFSSSSITFDVKGNLSGLEVGSFKLSNLEFGSEEVFNNLPKWPAMPVNKKGKFDFSAFMSFLGEATKMIK